MRRPWVEGEVEASRPGIDTPRHSRRGGVHEVLSGVDPRSALADTTETSLQIYSFNLITKSSLLIQSGIVEASNLLMSTQPSISSMTNI